MRRSQFWSQLDIILFVFLSGQKNKLSLKTNHCFALVSTCDFAEMVVKKNVRKQFYLKFLF